MTVVRGSCRGWLRRVLVAALLGAVIGLAPSRVPLARAGSVDSPFMLPDASYTVALSTGVLALSLGSRFPTGTSGVCAVVLTDAGAADAVSLTIYDSAGAVVSQRPAATGRIDFGAGIYNLVFAGLSYQGTAGGAWPDDTYRTDISLNGTVGASVRWTVGAGSPAPATSTDAPPTATAVPPTNTPLPPTVTPNATATLGPSPSPAA